MLPESSRLEAIKPSGEQVLHDRSVNIGEAEVATGKAIGQLLVIESKQVEHRRVKIMDVNRIGCHGEPEIVCLSVGLSPLHSTAGHPDGESIDVVIAPDAV